MFPAVNQIEMSHRKGPISTSVEPRRVTAPIRKHRGNGVNFKGRVFQLNFLRAFSLWIVICYQAAPRSEMKGKKKESGDGTPRTSAGRVCHPKTS